MLLFSTAPRGHIFAVDTSVMPPSVAEIGAGHAQVFGSFVATTDDSDELVVFAYSGDTIYKSVNLGAFAAVANNPTAGGGFNALALDGDGSGNVWAIANSDIYLLDVTTNTLTKVGAGGIETIGQVAVVNNTMLVCLTEGTPPSLGVFTIDRGPPLNVTLKVAIPSHRVAVDASNYPLTFLPPRLAPLGISVDPEDESISIAWSRWEHFWDLKNAYQPRVTLTSSQDIAWYEDGYIGFPGIPAVAPVPPTAGSPGIAGFPGIPAIPATPPGPLSSILFPLSLPSGNTNGLTTQIWGATKGDVEIGGALAHKMLVCGYGGADVIWSTDGWELPASALPEGFTHTKFLQRVDL